MGENKSIEHDIKCWCQNCWEEKLLHPEIVTDRIDEFRDYAEEEFKNQ